MKRIKLLCAAGLLGTLAMTSCTDLTEKVYSDLVRDNYYTDKLSVEAAVVRCFEHSDNVTWRGDIWKLQELTGDHFVWTQKGCPASASELSHERISLSRQWLEPYLLR